MPRPADELLLLTAVAVGGGGGAAARYAIGRLAAGLAADSVETFPWPTFLINVTGSFLLGCVAVNVRNHPQPIWWALLGTGFCGGFTTFSTFSLESLTLTERGRPLAAVGYALGSVVAGLAAAWLAMRWTK